ncbi:MAG: DUF5615 family PIN-like protein [Candidatus Micrarchaeota archaeon]|nr:DUF5615 family PIN-like protein [Candidatus Micrarchaeota archaeon]
MKFLIGEDPFPSACAEPIMYQLLDGRGHGFNGVVVDSYRDLDAMFSVNSVEVEQDWMKVLIDENLTPSLGKSFEKHGFVAEHVNNIQQHSDEHIYNHALEKHFGILSGDRDFENIHSRSCEKVRMLITIAGKPQLKMPEIGGKVDVMLDWMSSMGLWKFGMLEIKLGKEYMHYKCGTFPNVDELLVVKDLMGKLRSYEEHASIDPDYVLHNILTFGMTDDRNLLSHSLESINNRLSCARDVGIDVSKPANLLEAISSSNEEFLKWIWHRAPPSMLRSSDSFNAITEQVQQSISHRRKEYGKLRNR